MCKEWGKLHGCGSTLRTTFELHKAAGVVGILSPSGASSAFPSEVLQDPRFTAGAVLCLLQNRLSCYKQCQNLMLGSP